MCAVTNLARRTHSAAMRAICDWLERTCCTEHMNSSLAFLSVGLKAFSEPGKSARTDRSCSCCYFRPRIELEYPCIFRRELREMLLLRVRVRLSGTGHVLNSSTPVSSRIMSCPTPSSLAPGTALKFEIHKRRRLDSHLRPLGFVSRSPDYVRSKVE